MKNILTSKLIWILALGLFALSCEKSLDEIGENPNSPVDVNSEWFLTAAQQTLTDNMWDEWVNARTGMFYAQYWSATAYTEESRYQIREGVNRTFWRAYYGSLNDLNQVIRLAEEEGGPEMVNKIAIANTMKAWTYHVLTDTYGAIPFSQALSEDNLAPSYDEQPDVYTGIIEMLQTAAANMEEGSGSFDNGDLIYNGDVSKWKKFANSLLLRVAMRMVERRPGDAQDIFEDIASDPSNIMEGNNDNALYQYQSTPPNNNPINEDYKVRQDFAVSDVVVDYLDSLDDPRLGVYAQPTVETGEYVGLEYGLTNAQATAIPNVEVSMPGERVLEADFPGIYMLYSEVAFLLAEANARGWAVSGDAQSWYETGIESNMEFWGVTDDDAIDDYIASVPYDQNNYIDVIGTQKWIALYMQGLQGWFTFTRMDFEKPGDGPLLQEPAAGSLDPDIGPGEFPRRMTYPDEEYTLNQSNVTNAIDTDAKDERVWWDVN